MRFASLLVLFHELQQGGVLLLGLLAGTLNEGVSGYLGSRCYYCLVVGELKCEWSVKIFGSSLQHYGGGPVRFRSTDP